MPRAIPYPTPGEILLEEFLKPMGITQEKVTKGEVVQGPGLPSEPDGNAEAVAQPKPGLLERIPEEESGLYRLFAKCLGKDENIF